MNQYLIGVCCLATVHVAFVSSFRVPLACVWLDCAREVHLLLKDAFPFLASRPLKAEMLTVEDAKRKHMSFPEPLQKRYMGFYHKRGCAPDSAVEVHFLFSRFRDIEFRPCIGYDTYQANFDICECSSCCL